MTNILKRFDNDGIELLINTETGESFASISGYARMSGKGKSTISRRLTGVASGDTKTAEIQTGQGVQSVALVNEDLIAKWLPKDNPVVATQLMKLGVRVFLHKMAGFEIKSEVIGVPKTPQTYLDALRALVAAEEQKLLLEEKTKILETENQQLAEAVDELFGYSSIIRIAKFNNVSEKAFDWRKLKAASQCMGLDIKRVPCPRFETKLLYSHDAWRFCYPEMKLPETTTLAVYGTH
jgi:hypothetical protein